MRTAVDTNVFSVMWNAAREAAKAAELLEEVRLGGSVVISPLTYAELLAKPGITVASLDELLRESDVQVDFALDAKVWIDAGERYSRYCARRRRSGGGMARRMIGDFIVGSHALVECDQLLTFDVERFRIDYPELALVGV